MPASDGPSTTLAPLVTIVPLAQERSKVDDTIGRTPPSLEPAPLPGAVRPLGGAYERRGLLGQGGVGVVHLAHQTVLDRDVAVKSVNPAAPPRSARRSLLQEARAAAALEHPNVVPVYDLVLGEDDEPQVVMRRIEGRTWSVYLAHPDQVQADFGARDVLGWHLRVLTQVCNAIHAAHSRGILHRDLKPDNVMIGGFGEVYVLDWGLATRISELGPADLPLARDDRRVVGTPRYMAPEMARGEGTALSPRTDVYLLAGLLYCILAGRGPHGGDSIEEVLASIATFRPVLPAGTPLRLVDLVQRGMAVDPADRPPSAEAFRLAVQGFLEERGADALAEEATEQLGKLEAALASGEVDRQGLYRHFGAARFGFQQALRAWPDHPLAAEGLRRALVAMTRYELAQGDDRAADVHLAELAAPPDALLARKAALLAARRAEEARRAAADVDRDPTVGRRTRIFVFSLVMLIWTIIPLVSWLHDAPLSHQRNTVLHAITLSAVIGLVIWARDSLSRTALNRRIASFLVVIQAVLVVGDLGGWLLGVDPHTTVIMNHLLFATVCGVAVQVIGRPAGFLAVAYAAAFLLGAWRPDWILPLGAACNLLVAVVAFLLWKPDDLRELRPPQR